VGFHVLALKAHCWCAGFLMLLPLSFNVKVKKKKNKSTDIKRREN
jgi:hypothetical protein